MKRPEIMEAMALVSTYWPNWRMPSDRAAASAMVDAWGRLLGDLEADAVVAAIEAYAVTGADFAPGPGVLRKRALELSAPNVIPGGDEAWAEILGQISRVGYMGTPEFSHPAVEVTVRAFGWLNLCQSMDQMVDRAHFLKLYEGVRQRATFEVVAPPSVKALAAKVAAQLGLGSGGEPPGGGPRHVLAPLDGDE